MTNERRTHIMHLRLCSILPLLLCGCPDTATRRGLEPATAPSDEPVTTGAQYNLRAEDFALDLAVAEFKELRQDGADIQAALLRLRAVINDPDKPINRVDLDQDGKTDYVIPDLDKGTIDFAAHRSSLATKGPDPDPVVVGSIRLQQDQGKVTVSAGYPTYVVGHDAPGNFYRESHDSSFASGLLVGALLAQPTYVYHPAPLYGPTYATWSHPVVERHVFIGRQTTYRTTHHVTVTRAVRPPNFSTPTQARWRPPASSTTRTTTTVKTTRPAPTSWRPAPQVRTVNRTTTTTTSRRR